MKTYKLTLKSQLVAIEVAENETLLEALKRENIYIKSSCGGHQSCGDCVGKIEAGEDSLTPPIYEELKLLGNTFHITKERLLCGTKIQGNVTVDVSHHDRLKDESSLSKKKGPVKKMAPNKLRSKNEVDKIKEERFQHKETKAINEEKWVRYWEKDSAETQGKKIGGNRRPKFFSTDEESAKKENPKSATEDREFKKFRK